MPLSGPGLKIKGCLEKRTSSEFFLFFGTKIAAPHNQTQIFTPNSTSLCACTKEWLLLLIVDIKNSLESARVLLSFGLVASKFLDELHLVNLYFYM